MEGKEIFQSGILSLQIDAFTTLFANEPRDIGQLSADRFDGVITIK